MGGRDHALTCEHCGGEYSGFNGPDECPCQTPTREGEFYEFGLSVQRLATGEWKVVIDHLDEERASTFSESLDVSLKMALPYIATCCEPDPFLKILRETGYAADRAEDE